MAKLTIWIARDGDGRLFIHFEQPRMMNLSLKSWTSHSYSDVTGTPLDDAYADLTVENGPVKRTI